MNKAQPRPTSSHADAGSVSPTDVLGAVPNDGARELARDVGADSSDLGLDLPREVGPATRDTGADLGDLPADRRPDVAEVPPDRPRDIGADLVDLADLPADRRPDVAEVSPDRPRDIGAEAGPEARPDLVGDTGARMCQPGENYILVLGTDDNLYRFYPDTLAMFLIGPVSCGTPGRAMNSLTVSPLGPAYISNNYGEMCDVDLDTFVPSRTSFDATAIGNHQFGMAVVPDDVPAGQTLYIAIQSGTVTLARVDLTSFAMTTVGSVAIRRDGGIETPGNVELTAGSQGELYGFSMGRTQSLLLTIDPKTGEAIDVSQVPAGASSGSFALVDWHGTIYLFLGSQNDAVGSSVFTYRKGDPTVSSVGTLDVDVLGAGVALCH